MGMSDRGTASWALFSAALVTRKEAPLFGWAQNGRISAQGDCTDSPFMFVWFIVCVSPAILKW